MIEFVESRYQDILRLLAKNDVAVVGMPVGHGLPPVAFTVGGAMNGRPDLLMYGVEPHLAHPILNHAFDVVRKDWPFENFRRASNVVEGRDVMFRDVSRSDLLNRTMFLTHLFNTRQGHQQTPLLQVLWPDVNGLFPHQVGCDPNAAATQRVKGLRN